MQRETSNDSFLDYGSVYHQPIDREHPELIHQTMVAITRRYVSQFYCCDIDAIWSDFICKCIRIG